MERWYAYLVWSSVIRHSIGDGGQKDRPNFKTQAMSHLKKGGGNYVALAIFFILWSNISASICSKTKLTNLDKIAILEAERIQFNLIVTQPNN
ncbi:MAG: hypothetical protein AB7I49_03950 [Candidatus Nitrosocosmicus sp.]